MPIKLITLLLSILMLPNNVFATETPHKIIGEVIEYKDGDTVLEGYYVPSRCGDLKETYPTVMVIHQWKGLTDNERMRAEMLSRQCYNAFAIDMYGKGIRPTTNEDAAAESGKYKKNADLALSRMNAALTYLKARPHTDQKNIGAIGYCFGGGMVLELARSGADVKAVGSFHGALSTAIDEYNPKDVTAEIAVYHGEDDPYISAEELDGFKAEMLENNIDYEFLPYPNAVHAFTQIEAGTDNSKGAAYNLEADRKSWAHLVNFLAEEFQTEK